MEKEQLRKRQVNSKMKFSKTVENNIHVKILQRNKQQPREL